MFYMSEARETAMLNSIFTYAPLIAVVGALPGLIMFASGVDVTQVGPIAEWSDSARVVVSAGGPLGIAWMFHRKYIKIINSRADFLQQEVRELRSQVTILREERDRALEGQDDAKAQIRDNMERLIEAESKLDHAYEQLKEFINYEG